MNKEEDLGPCYRESLQGALVTQVQNKNILRAILCKGFSQGSSPLAEFQDFSKYDQGL